MDPDTSTWVARWISLVFGRCRQEPLSVLVKAVRALHVALHDRLAVDRAWIDMAGMKQTEGIGRRASVRLRFHAQRGRSLLADGCGITKEMHLT